MSTIFDHQDDASLQPGQNSSPAYSEAFWNLERILESKHADWSPGFVENVIQGLQPDELARALVRACFYADIIMAKFILQKRGPFEVVCEERDQQVLINGEVVGEEIPLGRLCEEGEIGLPNIQSLMEWMPTVGLGFMCGVGTDTALLLNPGCIEKPINQLSWASHFNGALPVFSYGCVDQPELVLALDEKVRTSHYADAFDQILCWVEEATLLDFQDEFHAFEPIHSLSLARSVVDGGDEVRVIPVSEVTELSLSNASRKSIRRGKIVHSDEPWHYQGLTLEMLPVRPGAPTDNVLLGYQADASLKHGFNLKSGHVLCRTRVSFLREFSVGPLQQDNLAKAKEFAANYFPLDLMMLQVPQPNVLQSGCVRMVNGMRQGAHNPELIKDLYRAFGNDSPLQPHLQKSLTPALLDYIRGQYCEVTLDADSMLSLFQGIGIDNKGYRVELDFLDLQRLHDAGFKFSSDSSTINPIPYKNFYAGPEHRNDSAKTEVRLDLGTIIDAMSTSFEDIFSDDVQNKQVDSWEKRYTNAFSMNLWPVQSRRPASVLEALEFAGNRKTWDESHFESALLAFIDHAGVKACAEVAKTDSHWGIIKQQFGAKAMAPYIREIPRSVRGDILYDAIGL